MAKELQLNIINAPIEVDDFLTQAGDFIAHFSTDENERSFKNLVVEQIDYYQLGSILSDVLNSDSSEEKDDNSFVRCVRICYGMVDSKIKLLFLPVYIDKDISTSDFYNINPSIDSAEFFYVFKGKVFKKIEGDEGRIFINEYKNQIKIGEEPPFAPFVQDVDIEAVLFPFKEIKLVYQDNDPDCEDQSTEKKTDTDLLVNDGMLYFTSVAVLDTGKYQHHIIICPVDPTKIHDAINTTFKGKAANMSNLCPPNCERVQIKDKIMSPKPEPLH